MENEQQANTSDFINSFLNRVHATYESEDKYGKFYDEFKESISVVGKFNFIYLFDSLEKAREANIKIENGFISDNVDKFLRQFCHDYDNNNNMDLSRDLLNRIDPDEVRRIFDFVTRELNAQLSKGLKEYKGISENISKNKEAISGILESASLKGFSYHYNDIQNEENTTKNVWLFFVVILGFFLLLVIGESLHNFFYDEMFDFKKSILKSIYIGALAIIFIWLCKQYSLSKRQFLIYRHLTSSMTAYKLIDSGLSSGSDEKLKSTLLCEIARTIFPIPDGKATDSQQLPLMQILDLVKNVTNQEKNDSTAK